MELLALSIAHPVIVRRTDARQQGVGDLSPDRLVESEELLQELRRDGHNSSLPEPPLEVDCGRYAGDGRTHGGATVPQIPRRRIDVGEQNDNATSRDC